MNLRPPLLVLCFLGSAFAQGQDPIDLRGKDHAPICRGTDGDASDCVRLPRATYRPDPDYPEKARKKHHRGSVLMELIVDADGRPQDVRVSRGAAPELNTAAVECVKKWKFLPASRNGKAVATQINVEVSFNLY
jgi:TonB family protein